MIVLITILFRSIAQGHLAIKDANTAGNYIDIKHIVTGNYGLVSAATDLF